MFLPSSKTPRNVSKDVAHSVYSMRLKDTLNLKWNLFFNPQQLNLLNMTQNCCAPIGAPLQINQEHWNQY